MTQGNNGSQRFSGKYEITTLASIVYTCRLHIDDMFYEMPLMDNRGLVMVFFILVLLHHYFLVLLLISSYESILDSGLAFGLEKVA